MKTTNTAATTTLPRAAKRISSIALCLRAMELATTKPASELYKLVERQAEDLDRAEQDGLDARTALLRNLTRETDLKRCAGIVNNSGLVNRIARAGSMIEHGEGVFRMMFKALFGRSVDDVRDSMKTEVCPICDREFPAGTFTAWDGDVCDECAAEHAKDLGSEVLPDGRLDINTPPT